MKIASVVAHKDFRDEEYFIPREILENKGFSLETFSDREGLAIGSEGGEVQTEDFRNISVDNFSAIVVAGGSGAVKYLDNGDFHRILNNFHKKEKIIAAICISPIILAKIGILDGKKATVWASEMNKSAVSTLTENGAKYMEKPVVKDGNLITANGPEAAEKFGIEISRSI